MPLGSPPRHPTVSSFLLPPSHSTTAAGRRGVVQRRRLNFRSLSDARGCGWPCHSPLAASFLDAAPNGCGWTKYDRHPDSTLLKNHGTMAASTGQSRRRDHDTNDWPARPISDGHSF
ncbi:hypothetical protein BT67DRAFT_79740 [Trichocladium antarcticum]|uniref:Uncharacterized protein n=1 Tax=Trichocladium antarcticum TaxID=1450529 RepID=A0AAN6UGX2_9PEZI|nr:hypothetical protein BT67DRAFT_79740 [Trichocladium antarcticum]